MNRWQTLAETNPSVTEDQQALLGLLVLAELQNARLERDRSHDTRPSVAPSRGAEPA